MESINIVQTFFENQDLKYKDFHTSIVNNLGEKVVIGVRVPIITKLAKEIVKDPDFKEHFLNSLPHTYYEENLLHMKILLLEKNFDRFLLSIESFIPYIDNWAVCDNYSPKCLQDKRSGKKEILLERIKTWVNSDSPYTVRYGLGMLMTHFLDLDFKPEFLNLVLQVRAEEYYVKMMIAWFIATALAKQWNQTVKILEDKKLSRWVHNKAIQKAIESYRVTDEHKEYLRTLRVK